MTNQNKITVKATVNNSVKAAVTTEYAGGGTANAAWGSISGTLANQTDLQSELDLKANLTDIPDVSNYVTNDDMTAALAEKQDAGNYVTKTDKTNINVIGVNKSTQTISGTIFAADGIVFGGTAKAAGLVTRGICGITTPTDNYGSCEKEHLYINFDGTNEYTRQLVLAAPNAGTKIDNTTYGYTYGAIRGDDMVQYVTAQIATLQTTISELETRIEALENS